MKDLLRMDYINSLGQLYVRRYGRDWWWPVTQICVETGCMTMDVVGKSEPTHIGEAAEFKDDDGNLYDPEDFYIGETLDEMECNARAAVQSVIDKAAARHLAAMASTWATP